MTIKIHLFRWWLYRVLALITVTAGVASLGGAATMGTNNSIAQTGDGVGLGDVQWGRVGESALVGGISGFAGGAAGHWAANSSVLVNGINSPIARTLAVAPLASGAGHLAGGTASGVFKGQGFSMAFNNSFKGLGKSMLIGTGIGVASTVGVSYANGINPINGKPVDARGSTNVFRAVSKAELDDIAKFGLRNKAGAYETGKLFAPTAREAAQFGRNNFMFDDLPNTIMKVRVPNSVLNNSYRFGADGMNAISIPSKYLHFLKATPLNYTPLR